MKRLRVLHLDAGQTWRGGQRQALLLCLGLRARGHEPYLIGVPDSPLVTRARLAGLPVGAITMRADWDVRAARRIRARIKAWRPDLVHAHDARSHALALMALVASPVPLVVSRRVPFTPRSSRMKYGERVDRFIAISRAVRDAMVAGAIDPRRIDVVYSGIELPREVAPRDWRAELDWPVDAVICGVVGAMTAEKGVDLLAQIAAGMPVADRRHCRLVLLGGHSAGRMEIGGIPAFSAGFVDEISNAVAGLDILFHPSRAEGLGTAVLDAMALAVPPIAFGTGGLVEVIEHGSSGILVPPGDVKRFAAEAARLIRDPGSRKAIGAAAQARARDFSAGRMTHETETVYNGIVRG